jgi:hypothetical protein
MKVALMLTGLARRVQDGYDGYWKHIIENYDVDLYLHAWETKPDSITNHEDSDDVIRIYKNPKYINVETPFKFTKYREGIDNPNNDNSRPLVDFDVYGNFRSFPMYYGWQSTYNHIINSDVNYDCVIRSRYDLNGIPLDLKKLDLTKINVASNHWGGTNINDDNFCATNKEISNKIFGNIFNDIVSHHKELGTISGAEQNFTNFLIRKNLHHLSYKSPQIQFNLLRDNKLWY